MNEQDPLFVRFNRIEDIFDDSFQAITYNYDSDKLQSVEIMIILDSGEVNLLRVSTLSHYIEESALESDEEVGEDAPSFVIDKEELLPSDLLSLKKMPVDELRQHFVRQEQDET